jgi:hypothetical protein
MKNNKLLILFMMFISYFAINLQAGAETVPWLQLQNNQTQEDKEKKSKKEKNNEDQNNQSENEDLIEYKVESPEYFKIEIQKIKENKRFNKKTKSIAITKKQEFVDISIPIKQISEVKFDKPIIKIETSDNPKNKITKSKDNFTLSFENVDLDLEQNVAIIFNDGQKLNLSMTNGVSSENRFIYYNIILQKKKIATIKGLEKKLKIDNIHDYFNNLSMNLIIDKLRKKDSFLTIEENKIIPPKDKKTIFDEEEEYKTEYGKVKQHTQIDVEAVYETAYIEDTKNENIKNRIIMFEIKITNKDMNNFQVSVEYIKSHFSNFITFYIGNVEKGENILSPYESMKALVVIEDKMNYEEENLI